MARRAPALRGRILLGARRIAAAALVVLFAIVGVEWWSALGYLAALYEGLGSGVWPAALALFGIPLTLVALTARWLLAGAAGHPGWLRRPRTWALVAATASASVWLSWAQGRVAVVRTSAGPLESAALVRALSGLSARVEQLPRAPGSARPLIERAPVECDFRPRADGVTLVATASSRARERVAESACFQAARLDEALGSLVGWLERYGARGPLKIDVLAGVVDLGWRHSWLNAFKLRPGLDGVCFAQRCLMPWQLLSGGEFSTYRPLPFIADLQFGVSLPRLLERLGAGDQGAASLERITTYSYVIDPAAPGAPLTPLRRMRRSDVEVSSDELVQALRRVQRHVLAAQLDDGRFRYTLSPFDGRADTRGFNLARQAGALLALCELGDASSEVNAAIRRGLGTLKRYERRVGEVSVLTLDPGTQRARLGESALPLVSLLRCGERTGYAWDELVVRLTRYLLALQRPDGSFARYFDRETGRAIGGGQPLYASGQAVMALLLIERRQNRHPNPALPSLSRVHEAAERAMTYFATDYWSHPLRDFFFLEENWHCLAARESLSLHPHPGYEDFCWDYVRFKSRLILETERGADRDFDGGFGFGNLVPPHNTGAAGFAEAMAAALELQAARGEQRPESRKRLERVLGFLLRQQWSPDNCFACASPDVLGGMSEHTHSAVTRIDFAQHAWAALGHGGRVLGRLP